MQFRQVKITRNWKNSLDNVDSCLTMFFFCLVRFTPCFSWLNSNNIWGDLMEEGKILVFDDSEDFLKVVKKLENAYCQCQE